MTNFEQRLVNEAYLTEESKNAKAKMKEEYIRNAEPGLIIAFRLNFEALGKKLTKVISGKVIENNNEKEEYIVETKNGLKYGVPYNAVIWVKTGARWPRGVYEEMKNGAVEVAHHIDFGGVNEAHEVDDSEDNKDVSFEL